MSSLRNLGEIADSRLIYMFCATVSGGAVALHHIIFHGGDQYFRKIIMPVLLSNKIHVEVIAGGS